MNAPSTARALQWTARILGALVVLLFLVFLIGEGPPQPSLLIPIEKLTFAAVFLLLLGLVLAWRWPALGGCLSLTGYLLNGMLGGVRMLAAPPFAVGGLAAILHLACWWISNRSEWRVHGGPRRLAITLACLSVSFLTLGFWLSLGAHSLEARLNVTPQIAGRWFGTTYVSDTRLSNKPLAMDITIFPDGAFEGEVGTARIVGGLIKPHLKGRIGYLQSKLGEPGYVMELDLSQAPLTTPRPAKPGVSICFDVRGGQLVGAVHASDGPEDLRDLHAVLHR